MGAKVQGERIRFRCPRHEDHDPSAWTGGGAWGCFACGFEESITTLAPLLGIDMKNGSGDRHARREVVASYIYHDENGAPLFRVCRTAAKDFYQERADGNGGWISGRGCMKGVRRVPYRLPAVVAAVQASAPVYIVEGEKDADAMRAAGAFATCNPTGAGKWKAGLNVHFKGADVVIVADKDEAGYKHARQVEQHLTGIARSITVVQAAIGKDASDHLDEGLRPEDFVPAVAPEDAADSTPLVARLAYPHAIPACDVVEERPEFFVDGLIPARELTIVYGRGGAGKTTLALQLAGAAAAGDTWLDAFDCQGGAVLVVTGEDTGGILRNRLEALCHGHGWDRDQTLARVHILEAFGLALEDEGFQAHLVAEAQRVGARLVILDPLKYLVRGNENSNTEMAPVCMFIARLCREANATAAVLHHETKPGEDRRNLADRLRGASALYDA
ncbi:MAG: AAA family ATPase, partial [Geminicoccales bacterium]